MKGLQKLILYTMVISMCVCIIFSDANATVLNGKDSDRLFQFLVIHSYDLDYEWTKGQDEGVQHAFKEWKQYKNYNIKIERMFLDSKKILKDREKIAEIVSLAKQKIIKINPDGVILTDDFAFIHFYKFLQNRNIQISFTGINGDIYSYGYRDHVAGVTGSLERYNFPVLIKIMRKIKPSIRKVSFISDDTITGQALIDDVKNQIRNADQSYQSSVQHSFFSSQSWDKLKSYLKSLNSENTAIIFVAFYTYKDEHGNIVDYKTIDKWVNQNTKLLDGGSAFFHVKNGRMISLASSAFEIGYYATNKLFKGILTGVDLSQYPIRQYIPLQLVINHERANKLGVNIPFDILSYAKNNKRLFNNE